MELRVLKYFLTVTRVGNITKASEILHITQPTLSRQLIELEDELGTTLFNRGKRSIVLTEAGILLQKRAEEIIGLVNKTEDEFKVNKGFLGGIIKIGCVESVSVEFLINVIDEFTRKYPNIRCDFYNGYGDDIKYRLDKGLVDIGVLLEPIEISKYEYIKLHTEDIWGVLVPSNCQLASKKSITTDEIAGLPLILPYRQMSRSHILSWFKKENVNVVATYNLLSNLIFMIEKGKGYAICLNGALVTRNNERVTFVSIEPKRTANSVVVWKKNHELNEITKLFLEEINNALRAL